MVLGILKATALDGVVRAIHPTIVPATREHGLKPDRSWDSLGPMRSQWSLIALLAAIVAVLWIVAGQREQNGGSRAGQKDAGKANPPTLHGKARTSTPPKPEPHRRQREPCEVTVRGRVLDGAGRPLALAQVQAVSAEWRGKEASVDVDGRFTLGVTLMGAMRVGANAPGHLPWLSPWLGAAGAGDLELGTITLQPGHAMEGRVLFEDGLPAPAVHVAASPEDDGNEAVWLAWKWSDGWRYPSATTDEQGRFRIDRVPEGTYTLMAAWGSWNEAAIEGVRADRSDVTIRIQRLQAKPEPPTPSTPPERVLVLVDLTTEDGGPVPKCYAALFLGESRWPGSQKGPRITFPVPAPGDYTLYVRPEDRKYASRVLRDLDVQAAPYAVTLRHALIVEGVVRLHGEPVAKASVRAAGRFRDDGSVEAMAHPEDWRVGHETWTTETDEQGKFRIVGIAPGTVELTASSRSCRQQGASLMVAAGSSGHVITMRENPSIRLRVHAPDGEDVGAVEVIIQRVAAGGLAWERRIMDWGMDEEEGPRPIATYEFDVSDAEAEYAVSASNESATADGESPLVRGIRPGAEPADIHLAARPPPLRVLVVDEQGRPVPGALVELRRFAEGRPILREPSYFASQILASPGSPDGGHTGTDGVYAFELRIPPGPWTVLAQGPGTAQVGRLPRVTDTQESVRVALHRGMRLMGKVEDPEGRSQWARFVEAWPLDGQQESVLVEQLPHSGRFEFTNLAPGRYVLIARPNNSFQREEENWHAISEPVLAGARGVRLTRRAGHRSTLDLRGPEGTRLADAEVRVVGRYVDREVVSDGDGLFQAIALPPGPYVFEVTIPDREPLSVAFLAGTNVTLRVP